MQIPILVQLKDTYIAFIEKFIMDTKGLDEVVYANSLSILSAIYVITEHIESETKYQQLSLLNIYLTVGLTSDFERFKSTLVAQSFISGLGAILLNELVGRVYDY